MPRSFALVAWLALTPLGAPPVAAPGNGGAPSFARDVAPILARHCVRCHGERESSGGLRLDGYDAVLRGGERGPVVVARAPMKSLLYRKITRRDRPFMPPKQTVPSPDIAAIGRWIEGGAAP